MPRRPLSPREIGEFRDRLCEVATRLFAERGYASVTLRALAHELGVSAMTPYRYFRNKDEILTAARAAGFARFAEAQERAARSTAVPVERLRAVASAYLRFGLEHPDAYRIMFELRQPRHEDEPALRRLYRRAFRPVQTAVGDAIRSGLLAGDRDTIAHTMWAACHGLVSLHLSGMLVLGRSLDDLEAPFLAEILRGARADGATPRGRPRRRPRPKP